MITQEFGNDSEVMIERNIHFVISINISLN